MSEAAISLKDVKIRYRMMNKVSFFRALVSRSTYSKTKYFEAVKGVSFEIPKGQILGIVGKNGSGKSTLLRAIAGIFSPDEGTIDLHGNTISLLSIGVGFQNALSGRENIYLSGMLLGFSREFIDEKLEEIIEFSELGDFIDRPVKSYSSGMYSKLAFSITAILETDIMLIDEVLSVGDAKFRKKSEKKIMDMFERGVTVIFVSHSLEQVQRLCDKAIILQNGTLLASGDIGEVTEIYKTMIN